MPMLTPRPETPIAALDLAFRRQKPTRAQLDEYELAQQHLLAAINPKESEEHLKNLIIDFLRHPGVLGPGHCLNVSKRRDLIVRTGPKEADPIGVIIEVKKAGNKAEMVTAADLNRKALHELLLYYLQDRDDRTGADLRRLVITNGPEWFVFDALDFDRLFWRNTGLLHDFRAWADKKKAGTTTDHFYTQIAQPFLAALDAELPFTYLDLRQPPATERESERDLITRAKLFQAPHLLKAPFAQDANTLNRAFYEELLYLIGLEEVKDKSRKLIKQVAPAEREQAGSLLRNTLDQLESEDLLSNIPHADRPAYGATHAEQLFAVALELCLTWVNRLLFLKLLEGQLRRYHAGNPAELTAPFRFLTPALLPDFDTVNELFFLVLNRPADQRSPAIQARYAHLPYLNSSLYETTELERLTLRISALDDRLTLPLHRKSVLPAQAQPLPTLAYLLRFLDAYDFASEGDEQVQETHKPLISAAVLGLIFEKINGYRDGSFYTPGFITMYMARHTLRRAVVQHFERRYGFGAASIEALEAALTRTPEKRPEFSIHFNTLTVLDPAVGSGHFLVSALNELLAIKAELRLLLDDAGRVLRYRLTVARDELVVLHEDDDPADPRALFQYRARLDPLTGARTVAANHTNLQRALFNEKRHLIEHALFGVDLNPNSVRICRLRLWIELLKHTYYLPETGFAQLDTLPNLDLNIKTGNSLLSRFALGADLSDVFRQGKFTLRTYRDAVHAYFNTRDRAAKQELQQFLGEIKEQFTATIFLRDPLRREILAHKEDLLRVKYEATPDMFGKAKISEEAAWERTTTLTMRLQKAEAELARREQGTLYREAFEWRFEFPEVLNEKGEFRGFDVVIGNPPYIRGEHQSADLKPHFKQRFATFHSNADLYVYFIELGLNLLAPGGELTYIAPNKWLSLAYGAPLRRWLHNHELVEFVDFGELYVFPQVKAYPAILTISQNAPTAESSFRAAAIPQLPPPSLESMVATYVRTVTQATLGEDVWSLADAPDKKYLSKLKAAGQPLGEYAGVKLYRGLLTGLNPAFVINAETRARLLAEDARSAEVIKPFLAGRHVKRYKQPQAEDSLILLPNGWTRAKLGWQRNARGFYAIEPVTPNYASGWDALVAHYPAVAAYLLPFENAAAARSDKGQFWWELRACDYYAEFEKPKIIVPTFATSAPYTYDTHGLYSNDKTTIIPTNDLFLLGVLNSSTTDFYFKAIGAKLKDAFFEYKPKYLSQLPIPPATPAEQAPIIALVEEVLAAKAAGQPTAALEAEIDALVAARYGLSPAEAAQLAT